VLEEIKYWEEFGMARERESMQGALMAGNVTEYANVVREVKEDTEVRVRPLESNPDKFFGFAIHKVNYINAEDDKKYRPMFCLHRNPDENGKLQVKKCPMCAIKSKSPVEYGWSVVVYPDSAKITDAIDAPTGEEEAESAPVTKLIKVSTNFKKQLKKFMLEKKVEDLTLYDLIIKRKGKGLNTVYQFVRVKANEATVNPDDYNLISEDDMKSAMYNSKLEEAEMIDFLTENTVTTYQGEILSQSTGGAATEAAIMAAADIDPGEQARLINLVGDASVIDDMFADEPVAEAAKVKPAATKPAAATTKAAAKPKETKVAPPPLSVTPIVEAVADLGPDDTFNSLMELDLNDPLGELEEDVIAVEVDDELDAGAPPWDVDADDADAGVVVDLDIDVDADVDAVIESPKAAVAPKEKKKTAAERKKEQKALEDAAMDEGLGDGVDTDLDVMDGLF